MEFSTIAVFFSQTGEYFDIGVSPTTTIKDVIKYVCESSVIKDKIDPDDYFLALMNYDVVLDDDTIFDKITACGMENPDYQVRMKTLKRRDIVRLPYWNI